VSAPFVAVIGTVNLDTIVTADGRRLESLGGILYNAIPLAALLEKPGVGVRIYARLGERHRTEAIRLLEAFPAVDASTLVADPAGTNLSLLDYSGPGERLERVEMRVPPLTRDDLAGAESARAILVNMISGRDVRADADIRPIQTGLINRTFDVRGKGGRFILQRLHPVFRVIVNDDPKRV